MFHLNGRREMPGTENFPARIAAGTALADWYQRPRSAAIKHFSIDIDTTKYAGYT
jgi:hypothetical protein